MPKDTSKNKKSRAKNKKTDNDNVDLMKDLPDDELTDVEYTISESDE